MTPSKRKSRLEQRRAHDAAVRGQSFRSLGINRQYFCPFQLRELDDTWTAQQSKEAICKLIAEARELDPKGIILSQLHCEGRVYHGAFSAYGSLIFTIYHGPAETLPKARMSHWEEKELRKVGKRLGIEGKLIVLEPLVLRDEDIRKLTVK